MSPTNLEIQRHAMAVVTKPRAASACFIAACRAWSSSKMCVGTGYIQNSVDGSRPLCKKLLHLWTCRLSSACSSRSGGTKISAPSASAAFCDSMWACAICFQSGSDSRPPKRIDHGRFELYESLAYSCALDRARLHILHFVLDKGRAGHTHLPRSFKRNELAQTDWSGR